MKYKVVFLDCARDCFEAKKEQEQLIEDGYLLTGQIDWDMIYEHPDLGNREDIIKRHNEYMSYLAGVGIS